MTLYSHGTPHSWLHCALPTFAEHVERCTDAGRLPATPEGDTMASGMDSGNMKEPRRELTLFDERSDGDFYDNARLINEWCNADIEVFSEASHHLTIGNLKAGIGVAESIARELEHRAQQARSLAENLRRVGQQAADFGLAVEATISTERDPLR